MDAYRIDRLEVFFVWLESQLLFELLEELFQLGPFGHRTSA